MFNVKNKRLMMVSKYNMLQFRSTAPYNIDSEAARRTRDFPV